MAKENSGNIDNALLYREIICGPHFSQLFVKSGHPTVLNYCNAKSEFMGNCPPFSIVLPL